MADQKNEPVKQAQAPGSVTFPKLISQASGTVTYPDKKAVPKQSR